MSEAKILAAFYKRGCGQFCELMTNEVFSRSGCTTTCADFMSLRMRRFILAKRDSDLSKTESVYRLSPSGERRVSEMIAMGTLPKAARVLTATPQGGAA